MTNPLLPTRFLFRFSAPCQYRDPLWTKEGVQLDEKYRLIGLAELEERAAPADVRAAWNEAGLAFTVHVQGKRQPPWCRESRPEDSDSLQIWIDTAMSITFTVPAASATVHLPAGRSRPTTRSAGGRVAFDQPCQGATNPVRTGLLKVCCQQQADGYILEH